MNQTGLPILGIDVSKAKLHVADTVHEALREEIEAHLRFLHQQVDALKSLSRSIFSATQNWPLR